MYLYAMERLGHVNAPPAAVESLHDRLMTTNEWTIPSIATLLGITPTRLHDDWMLAHATSGLAPAGTLPSLQTWDLSGVGVSGFDSRTTARNYVLQAAPGGYAAVWF